MWFFFQFRNHFLARLFVFFNVFLEGDHYGFLRLAEALIIGAKTFIHSVEIVVISPHTFLVKIS